MFSLGMCNVNSSVVKARPYQRQRLYLNKLIAVHVSWGEAGARNRASSSDTLVNPIALLVKLSKEMSPHLVLLQGLIELHQLDV